MLFRSTGVLDNSFPGGGYFNVAAFGISKVVLQTNDEIIVGGTTNNNEVGVMRFSSSGIRDMSYGGNGIATVPRVAAMKVAPLLAAHVRRNIFPHYGMKVFSDNSCGLFTLSPRLDKG